MEPLAVINNHPDIWQRCRAVEWFEIAVNVLKQVNTDDKTIQIVAVNTVINRALSAAESLRAETQESGIDGSRQVACYRTAQLWWKLAEQLKAIDQ